MHISSFYHNCAVMQEKCGISSFTELTAEGSSGKMAGVNFLKWILSQERSATLENRGNAS